MLTQTLVNWKSLWIFYGSVIRLINWDSNPKSAKEVWEVFKNLSVLARRVKTFARPKSVKEARESSKIFPFQISERNIRGVKEFVHPKSVKKPWEVFKNLSVLSRGVKKFSHA